MKTTELYVEQIFVGFIITAVITFPWLREISPKLLATIEFAKLAVSGSAAISFAFLIGIPFDRLADTLIERLNKYHRLYFTFELVRRGESIAGRDPYPEDKLLLACLRDRSTVISWMDYHRSRIRLTRALAVYGPALTVMATYAVMPATQPYNPAFFYGLIAATYFSWAVLVLFSPKVPRTNDEKLVASAKAGKWRYTSNIFNGKAIEFSIFCSEWRTWIAPILLMSFALAWAFFCRKDQIRGPDIRIVAGAGTILTVTAAWSWWRITETYRHFLKNCADPAGKQDAVLSAGQSAGAADRS